MIIDKRVQASTRQQWRQWLEEHHATEGHCWLILTDPQAVSYLDTVEEALCFGWVDSTKKKTDDARLAQRFSPRRKGSNWTELNKERVRRLERLGLMTDAGRAVLPAMDEDSFRVDEAILAELRQDAELYRNFQAMPELYVRIRIDNIQSVKQDADLYRSRLTKFIEHTRMNELYGQWNDGGRLLES